MLFKTTTTTNKFLKKSLHFISLPNFAKVTTVEQGYNKASSPK